MNEKRLRPAVKGAPILFPPKERNGETLQSSQFMHDVGRSVITKCNPNSGHDSFAQYVDMPRSIPSGKGKTGCAAWEVTALLVL